MISHLSNLDLNAANTIFNKYISYLLNKLDANNNFLQTQKNMISLLKLSPIDHGYTISSLEQMQLTNNIYTSLLLSFQQEYTEFASHYLHPIPFYSNINLIDLLNIHLDNMT